MAASRPTWTVLLLGGASGIGKTTIAEQLGAHFGVPLLQVDDLRLALQRLPTATAEAQAALTFFEETPQVWRLPAERLRDGLVAVGAALSPVLADVIEQHLAQAAPVVVEGDGILPSLLERSSLCDGAADGRLRAIFVVEREEAGILANLRRRGRDDGEPAEEELRAEARAKWLHGTWLADEARRCKLPVLDARPRETLAARIKAHLT